MKTLNTKSKRIPDVLIATLPMYCMQEGWTCGMMDALEDVQVPWSVLDCRTFSPGVSSPGLVDRLAGLQALGNLIRMIGSHNRLSIHRPVLRYYRL